MDRETLARQLAEGRSIESIARETGYAASTVAYWVNKHGLTSGHAARHAARGGIERETLEALIAEGLSIRAMAARLEVSVYDRQTLAEPTRDHHAPGAAVSRRPLRPGRPELRPRRRTAPSTG